MTGRPLPFPTASADGGGESTVRCNPRRWCGRRYGLLVAAVATALLAPSTAPAEFEAVVGTGSTAGVYYRVGRAICDLVNQDTQRHGVSCRAPSTAGSVYNATGVRSGELHVGVVQSDWQYHAYEGSSAFAAAGPDRDLRSVFSVHSEPFPLVARRDAGIRRLEDLVGKRVNIGNPGSGQRGTMEVVMQAMGWTEDTFLLAQELSASEMSLALCHDRIQAMVYVVGHPNAAVGKAIGLCDALIVEAVAAPIDRLVADNPFYAYTTIPGGMYSANVEDVTTFGVKATVVTSANVPDEVVATIVRAVFENFDGFRKRHPAFGYLTKEQMVSDGLSAPLHAAAEAYYREVGLLR
jgi:uncharacterized protein